MVPIFDLIFPKRTVWTYFFNFFQITEGNGLSALRQRLEQEGASLKVLCDNGVSLIVNIPFDFEEAQKGGRT